jgi:DNA-binding CsgD family transcriptional regulator
LDDGVIRFNDPLVAKVLYDDLTAEERRRIHARLGQLVADLVERARHTALSTVSPDPSVALTLNEAAAVALARGSTEKAGDLWELAWHVMPAECTQERARFLIQGARAWSAAGDPARSRLLLERALESMQPGVERAEALQQLARVRSDMDSQSPAVALLNEALRQPGLDDGLQSAMERDLAWVVAGRGDIADALAHARHALKLSAASGRDGMLRELRAAAAFYEFMRGNPSALDRLRRLSLSQPSNGPTGSHPRLLYALALKWSDDLGGARRLLDAMRKQAADRGEETTVPFLLGHLAELETWAGQWRTADRHASLGLLSATRSERQPMRAQLLYAKGLVEAHLGNVTRARRHAEAGANLSRSVGASVTWLLNQGVLGFLALSLRCPAEAAQHLGPMLDVLWTIGIEEPGVVRFVPDAIEALIEAGDLHRASSALKKYESHAHAAQRDSAEAAALRCLGLLTAARGDARRGVRTLEDAVVRHRTQALPFELGRSLLALGLLLRRARRQSAARAALEESLNIFQRLGASLWREQAQDVLSRRRGPGRSVDGLTPAELRVGRLVARGATNQEVARQLFVSIRAVEAHLTNIYRKLGIRSRTELAIRLSSVDSESPAAAG